MEKREMFEGKTSTNDQNHDQDKNAMQSGDNDIDRRMPKDDNADRETSQSYFGTNENDGNSNPSSENSDQQKDRFPEEKESLKNSK